MPTDLCGMVPTGFAVAVVEKAAELFDMELPGEAVDNTRRYFRKVLKKGAKETSGTELDGKTEAIVVAAVGVYELPVPIIQVKVAG